MKIVCGMCKGGFADLRKFGSKPNGPTRQTQSTAPHGSYLRIKSCCICSAQIEIACLKLTHTTHKMPDVSQDGGWAVTFGWWGACWVARTCAVLWLSWFQVVVNAFWGEMRQSAQASNYFWWWQVGNHMAQTIFTHQ